MNLQEAIEARHSVRAYKEKPLTDEVVKRLEEEIAVVNQRGCLHIQLIQNEPKAYQGTLAKYGKFRNVSNYLVMAGQKADDLDERIGYYGEHLVLLAQTLGLNTCWVGLTYKKIPGTFTLREGDVVHCVIALGYGATSGTQHPQKKAENFYECEGVPPQWFKDGLEAALLAPTAVNQQKFKFILHPGNVVEARTSFSMAGYVNIDLGIVKQHFEIGAGKDNFSWK